MAYTNGLLQNYRLPSLKNGSEAASPEIIRQWKSTHVAPVLVMKFSEEDTLLATGSADFNVKVLFFFIAVKIFEWRWRYYYEGILMIAEMSVLVYK